MQLVVTLVNQLEGTITLDRTKGTKFVITFKQAGVHAGERGGE
jgi:two-component sensor histidine kinase